MIYEPINPYIWLMLYNWQFPEWPQFNYQIDKIADIQLDFGSKSGQLSGALEGLNHDEKIKAVIDLMVSEAIKTSAIEGEFLSRQEVMSSIKKNLGVGDTSDMQVRDQRVKGIAKLMVRIRDKYQKPLSEVELYEWHKLLMMGNKKLKIGQWRNDESPMQVISGSIGKEVIHFEAPPSKQLPMEMKQFIVWFNSTAPKQTNAIVNPLIRSAITHLYFETIHPFEDGNGRIGRALSEKALSQGLGHPVLFSLSSAIESNKDRYYKALKKAQRSSDVTQWIQYFQNTIMEAQNMAKIQIDFSLAKTKFFDHYQNQLNNRQQKVIHRMLEEGTKGFEGGMSAKKYVAIAKTTKATATRDLQSLTDLGVFTSTGGGRSVTYTLNLGLQF